MKRIVTDPKTVEERKLMMETCPEEKMWEGVWDEVVAKVEGMGREEAAVAAVAARGERRGKFTKKETDRYHAGKQLDSKFR